ncbi:uncharacterized protein LOC122006773 [Zingiber officinale]|uniref:uncharacterized protein LOC122006773 n=1 Tax=Zingiber officinale TaxID=94328 RepID=UPI001C4B9D3E|nr:uncharacterized protein LOC122006773 [Zingiber officinale]
MEGEKTSLSAGAGATSKLPAVKGSKYNPTSENHIKKVVSVKDGKSQGCASRRHGSKDARPAQPAEPIESAYFGSSVNYGARDFYTSSLIMNTSETPSTYRKDGGNDLGSSDFATRGEWWQGSLYY